MAALAEEKDQVAQLRELNGRLKSENARLFSELAAVRPDTPTPQTPDDEQAPASETSADRLVFLMTEGARLLEEREALQQENQELADGIASLPDSDAVAAISKELSEAHALPPEGEGDGEDVDDDMDFEVSGVDLATLDQLLPLLSEGESLRAERVRLRTERQKLLGTLQESSEMQGSSQAQLGEQATGELNNEEAELERRLRGTLKDVVQENKTLQAEIDKLRAENERWRNEASRLATDTANQRLKDLTMRPRSGRPVRPPKAPQAAALPQEDDRRSRLEQQREAMASLLGRFAAAPSPTTKYGLDGNSVVMKKAASNTRRPLTGERKDQLRGTLHALYRSLEK